MPTLPAAAMARVAFLRQQKCHILLPKPLRSIQNVRGMLAASDLEIVNHPHDAYFKAVFSSVRIATRFFREHLPSELAKVVDWRSLKLIETSHVNDGFDANHCDLAFSLHTRQGPVLVNLLFEHQSTVQPAMALRMLMYSGAKWLAHLTDQGLPLPVVVPFVLHQGPKRWTAPRCLQDLFGLTDSANNPLREHLPTFQYGLLDLTQYDATTERDPTQRVILQLMKMARQNKVNQFFDWLAAETTGKLPPRLLWHSLLYAISNDRGLDIHVVANKLKPNKLIYEQTMSLAQKLLQEGLEKGLEQGLERGLAKGRLEGIGVGMVAACQRMAERKFGKLPATLQRQLESLDYKQAESLIDELFAMNSLTDLRAWLKGTLA